MSDQDTIPADILDAAKAISEQPWLTRAERDRMMMQIARAIMTERQRCADVVRSYSGTDAMLVDRREMYAAILTGFSYAPKGGEA